MHLNDDSQPRGSCGNLTRKVIGLKYSVFSRYKNLISKTSDIHLKELLTGGSTSFLVTLIGGIASYIFILLVSRNFGADAMGDFALSLTVFSIFTMFGRFGFDTALVRFVSEYTALGRNDLVKGIYLLAVRILVPISLALTVVLYLGSPYIAKYVFEKEYLTVHFRIISLGILPFSLTLVNAACFRGLKRIKEFSFFSNSGIFLLSIVILLVLIFSISDYRIPVISYISGILIMMLFSLYSWLRHLGFFDSPASKEIRIADLLKVSIPMLLSTSMFLIIHWTDTIMLGIYRPSSEVGIYNVSIKLATLTVITLNAINSIAAPKFADLYARKDFKSLEKIVRYSSKMIFWSSSPILILLLLFSPFILGLFGSEFKAGVPALMLLTIGQFVNAVSGSVGHILQMTGKQRAFQYIIMIATLLNVVLNYLLIPPYGINGAAVASMISVSLWNICAVVYLKRSLNINSMYIPVILK